MARIEESRLLIDFETTCRVVFYEKESASTHSDLINPVTRVALSKVSLRGVKATRSVAGLDLIAFQPFTRSEC